MSHVITKAAAALAALAILGGCATSGDRESSSGLAERLEDRQARYCSETSPVARAAMLAVIRSQVPGYPVSGLCTDAEQALAAEIAERLAELPEGATIDFEQAIEDQRRFQELNDEGVDVQ